MFGWVRVVRDGAGKTLLDVMRVFVTGANAGVQDEHRVCVRFERWIYRWADAAPRYWVDCLVGLKRGLRKGN
jgi:hypothetical protein